MPYKDPEKRRECKREWYIKNKEKARERARLWRLNNLDRAKQNFRRWLEKPENLEKIRAYYSLNKEKCNANSIQRNRRYRLDSGYRLQGNLRNRVWVALRGKAKSARTLALIGCGIPELRAHLEKQFRPGMTWENYGPVWHVDHIRPCASFDLSDPGQQKICFHYSNLQPLFKEENLKKGSKYSAHL